MALIGYTGNEQPASQGTEYQEAGSSPSPGYRGSPQPAPPPLPPRPAGFGFQPLPSGHRPSAASSQQEQMPTSASTATPQAPRSDSFLSQAASHAPERHAVPGRTSQYQASVDASRGPPLAPDSMDALKDGLEHMWPSGQCTDPPHDSDNGPSTSKTPPSNYSSRPYPAANAASSPPPSIDAQSRNPPESQTSASQSQPRDASLRIRMQPAPECIGIPVTFATTWYTHHLVPDYHICSYCYEEHIRPTRFQLHFTGAYLTDGQPRFCSFSRVRMKDRLFKEAVAKGPLDEVLSFMARRVKLPACVGTNGIKGPNPRGRWYRAKNNQLPNMVVCQGCYEDYVLAQRFAANFELAPEQPAESVWSCDFAVIFISEEYKRCSAVNDWPRFVEEVNTRMSLKPCPGTETVYPNGKQWFEPINGPKGFIICFTCWCDHIGNTSEESKWRHVGNDPAKTYGSSVKCCFGAFNMSVAANRTLLETHDYDLFWTAAKTLASEPLCQPDGTTNATWYTLKANPVGFAICRACYVLIAQTWGTGSHFVHDPSIGKDAKLICCFNKAIPRFQVYISKFLELGLTRDPKPLTDFATEYGTIPVCKRDNDFKNGRWFGWPACTICPECYHHFIRGTALEASMPLRGEPLNSWRMCEMYSPRMRNLYLEACSSNDPTTLLNYSNQRREIYAQTMIPHRQNLQNQQIKMLQFQNLSNQSLFYNSIGNNLANTIGYTHTYGQVGVGYGFRNEWELDGARYKQQANGVADQIRRDQFSFTTGNLVARWRQVE